MATPKDTYIYKTCPNVPQHFDKRGKEMFKRYCKTKIEIGQLNTSDVEDIERLVTLVTQSKRIDLVHDSNKLMIEDELKAISTYNDLSKQIGNLQDRIFCN